MPGNHNRRLLPWLVLVALLPGGCATTTPQGGVYDPLEPVNRKVYAFNDGFDRAIAQPVARAYDKVVPGPVSQGISNFFNNLDDVLVLINSVLQLKPRETILTANRLAINSTVGLFGLIDVVGMMGGEKADEDFGQTLGYWGLGGGPYLVLPFLGPSNLRDTGGLVFDAQYAPIDRIEPTRDRNAAIALDLVDTRAGLLGATDVLETAAIDPYRFTREAFTRRRANLVHDGNPPPETLPQSGAPGDEEEFDPFSDEDEGLFDDPQPGSGG